jgi:hypothetical protein
MYSVNASQVSGSFRNTYRRGMSWEASMAVMSFLPVKIVLVTKN